MEEKTTQEEGEGALKELFKGVIDGMLGTINAENVELYKALVDKASCMDLSTVDGFYFSLVYPHDRFLSGLIRSEISTNDDVGFILKRSSFIEHQFRGLIEDIEGSACCADKTRTIMNGLCRFYNTGERIEFDYDQEYTYHLPTKIFKTHESIVEFYEAIRGLYYGNPKKYLEALLNVKAQEETEQEEDQCQSQS